MDIFLDLTDIRNISILVYIVCVCIYSCLCLMYHMLHHFSNIKGLIGRLAEKHSIADDRKNYTKALALFQDTLMDASTKLENIYYEYVLCPQINNVHADVCNVTVEVASIVIVFYITELYRVARSVTALDHVQLGTGLTEQILSF